MKSCSTVESPASTFIALRLRKWVREALIWVGQPSMFGQYHLASPSSRTSGVPQSGQVCGNSGFSSFGALFESSTAVILGMISPPFST